MFTAFLRSIESPITDYDLSNTLGILESKVRNLRVKSQLIYPQDLDWISGLSDAISNGQYDREAKQITITLEDPNIRNLIRHKAESQYRIVNITLNSKQLVLPVETFLMLAVVAEKDPQKTIDRLHAHWKKEEITIEDITRPTLKKRIWNKVNNVADFIEKCAPFFEMGTAIINAIANVTR